METENEIKNSDIVDENQKENSDNYFEDIDDYIFKFVDYSGPSQR